MAFESRFINKSISTLTTPSLVRIDGLISCNEVLSYFRYEKYDKSLQNFLKRIFTDILDCETNQNNYIVSKRAGIELGFTYRYGCMSSEKRRLSSFLSHINIYPAAEKFLNDLPFEVSFKNNREDVLKKIGKPLPKRYAERTFYSSNTVIDHYRKEGRIKVAFEYDQQEKEMLLIQIRDEKLTDG